MRLFLRLCMLALLLASCSAPPSPIPIEAETPVPPPTMTPSPPPFRIIAYATDGVIEALIPYEQLTHINYSFVTPEADAIYRTVHEP